MLENGGTGFELTCCPMARSNSPHCAHAVGIPSGGQKKRNVVEEKDLAFQNENPTKSLSSENRLVTQPRPTTAGLKKKASL